MKESINNNKKLIISHIADVDGISSVILARLHFKEIDFCLVEFAELEGALKKLIDEDRVKEYDEIFITDLSIRPSTLELINNHHELRDKIKHFDHHTTELEVAKKYPFVNVVNERNGKLECGTTLFYEYIRDDFEYKSDYLDTYLEAVRAYDTAGPFCGNQYGVDLVTLFDLIGIEGFILKFYKGIRNGIDPVTEEDKQMIKAEYERMAEYIRQCDKNLVRIDLNGHKVGVSISEQYRSSVGNELSKKYKDELDYILIINFMRNQFSFRTVRDDVNVGLLAKNFTKDGGGHYKAAGMPLNADTMFIIDLVKESMLNIENSKLTRNV